MTPRGLSVRLSIKHAAKNVDGKRLTAVLRCYDPGIVGYIGIRLEKVKGSEYRRVDCHRFEGAYESGTPTQLFVPQTLVAASKPAPSTQVAVYVKYIGVGNVRSSPPFQDSDYVITVRKRSDHTLVKLFLSQQDDARLFADLMSLGFALLRCYVDYSMFDWKSITKQNRRN